jgi:hypothetical protein
MKAFLASIVVAIVIAVGAFYVLDGLGHDAQSTYSSKNVRL